MKRRAQRRIDCGGGAGGAMLVAQNASAARMPVASLLSFAIAVTAAAPAAAGVQSATAADAKPAVAAPVDPLFDCYRLNYAWGFTLAGSVVGRDGTILHYDGQQWTALDSGTTEDLDDVSGFSEGRAIVVARSGVLSCGS